ncbi:hypothetical protein WM34_21595 [Burkholderia ubonensis]|nr:hypothetical protein WJ69_33925 [Burkholderia ubonensis]KWO89755.1 hypothetical protein WM34_21595 [Burkholderia ubonensis]
MKGCAALARPAGVKEISCEVIFQEYQHVGAGVADDLFGSVDFLKCSGKLPSMPVAWMVGLAMITRCGPK